MKQRIITVTATFDISNFQEDVITSKEKVKKMVTKDKIEEICMEYKYE